MLKVISRSSEVIKGQISDRACLIQLPRRKKIVQTVFAVIPKYHLMSKTHLSYFVCKGWDEECFMVTSFVLRGHNFTFSTKNWEKLARYARMIAVCSFFLVHLCGCSHSSPSSEASSTLRPRQVLLKLIFFHYISTAENSSRLSPVVPVVHLMWSETLYAIRVVWGGVKTIRPNLGRD